jgi:phosphoketolase
MPTLVNEPQLQAANPALTAAELQRVDAYWRACNYVCAGMIICVTTPCSSSRFVPNISAGLLKLFRAFSFPGHLGSHCTPEVPQSIHEGGELGYSVSHAFGAALALSEF